jgi:hypothetical protein
VNLDLLGQSFTMDAYTVDNPQGFGGEGFLHVQRGRLEVDGGTIFSDTLHVPRLELSGIELNLVQLGRDGNYRTILDNIHRFQSPQDENTEDEGGKSLAIDEVVIDNVRVSVRLELADREPTVGSVQIDELVLHDVGGEGGMPVGQLVATITQGLLQSTLEASGGELPSMLEAGIRQRLAELPALASLGIDLDTKGATVSLRDLDPQELLDQAKDEVLDVLGQDDSGGEDG